MPIMSRPLQEALTMLLPSLLELAGLFVAVLADPYIRRRHRRVLLIITALLLALILQDVLQFLFEGDPTHILARTISSVVGYSLRPAVIVLFFTLLDDPLPRWPLWLLTGLNAAIYCTAFLPVNIAFTYSPNSDFIRGPLGYSCHVVSFGLLAWLMIRTVLLFRKKNKAGVLIPILNAGILLAAALADGMVRSNVGVSFVTLATVNSSLFFYVWLHLQYVREHEQALMAEHRIRIMISQIQPHFLFNTLTTIQALCDEDPSRAAWVTQRFAAYLRQNLDALDQASLIPFAKELEHTRIYAEIEQVRFPSIHITYAIETEDFSLPALTVQPLVENAIRHGVRILDHGEITVSTRRQGGAVLVEIRDNGRGFDPETVLTEEGSHIGLRNVRERVEKLCGGVLHIRSAPGEGACITLEIPAEHPSPAP